MLSKHFLIKFQVVCNSGINFIIQSLHRWGSALPAFWVPLRELTALIRVLKFSISSSSFLLRCIGFLLSLFVIFGLHAQWLQVFFSFVTQSHPKLSWDHHKILNLRCFPLMDLFFWSALGTSSLSILIFLYSQTCPCRVYLWPGMNFELWQFLIIV